MAKQLNKIALKTKLKLSLKSFFSNLCSSRANNSTKLKESCKPSLRIGVERHELTVRDDSPLLQVNDNDSQYDFDILPMLWTRPEMRKQRSKLSSTFIDTEKVLDHGDECCWTNDDQYIEYSQITHMNTQYRVSIIECEFWHEPKQTMPNYMVIEQTEVNTFINHIYESPQAFSQRLPLQSDEFSQIIADSFGFRSNEFQTMDLFQTINDKETLV